MAPAQSDTHESRNRQRAPLWLQIYRSPCTIAGYFGEPRLLLFFAMLTIDDYIGLAQAGFLKGLDALFGGLIGGFGFSTALTLLFLSIRNPYGIAGSLIVVAAMLIGIRQKYIS